MESTHYKLSSQLTTTTSLDKTQKRLAADSDCGLGRVWGVWGGGQGEGASGLRQEENREEAMHLGAPAILFACFRNSPVAPERVQIRELHTELAARPGKVLGETAFLDRRMGRGVSGDRRACGGPRFPRPHMARTHWRAPVTSTVTPRL